jgi:hypothetical protein
VARPGRAVLFSLYGSHAVAVSLDLQAESILQKNIRSLDFPLLEENKETEAAISSTRANERERIEAWLEAEGISFESVKDFNSHFHIAANLKNIQVQISEPKVRRGVLAVQAVVSLDDQQVWKASKIRKEDLHTIFLSLFEKLDRSEYLFMLQEDFFSKSWLRIQRTLYIEDITRTSLLNEMKDLNVKFVGVNYDLNEALDNAPKSDKKEETIYT